MRNLRNIRRSEVEFPSEELGLSAAAWDSLTGDLICALGPSPTNSSIQIARQTRDNLQNERTIITSWDVSSSASDGKLDGIVHLQYFADSKSAFVVLRGGDLISVREEPLPGEDAIEIVGTVDDGILAASWSPDEEILAILTGQFSMLLMSRDFEPIADVKFSSDDHKISNHVNVGWGKSETQFKGKRAKALRDPTVPEHVDEGSLSSMDDGRVEITWRGDGEYLAINCIDEGKRRTIRVFSRTGTLDSVSESVDGLEGALSWRPAGNLIASIKRHNGTAEVVFFERNGLRHGGFPLRLSPEEMNEFGTSIGLHWNADSTVLAVSLNDRVQLWTMGNYHYYLKQTVKLDGKAKMPVNVRWNNDKRLLVAFYQPEILVTNEYVFDTTRGSLLPPNDSGTVAVVDGSLIKLTPIRNANIPPPMSLHDLKLSEDAIDVKVNTFLGMVAVLSANAVHLYRYPTTKRRVKEPEYVTSLSLPERVTPYQIEVSDQRILAVLTFEAQVGSQVFVAHLNTVEPSFEQQPVFIDMEEASNLFTSVDKSRICVESSIGQVAILNIDAEVAEDSIQLPEYCPWVEITYGAAGVIAYGLSSKGSLYANSRLLAPKCTSFLVTSSHLIFTTSQHLLKFVHLGDVEELEIPLDEPEKDERCRSIERGARLVTVMPSTFSLVLQMPRGNLETIYPRALVLAGIRRSIDESDYSAAFLTCRTHRVDMNIIYDYDPNKFIKEVDSFVQKVDKIEYIDLFLSQLRNEDVTKTMYRDTVRRDDAAIPSKSAEQFRVDVTVKVNSICDAFLEVLKLQSASRLQNIITAHVCKTPPDLVGGLKIISELKGSREEDLAEKAAEHICFLADVNQLYENALGIYDLDVALLIAQQSQKDPREYLPYLQSLQEMPALREKFQIDNDLRRYEKALGHLHDLGEFEELQGYMEKHELYSEAMDLYKYQDDRLRKLMRLHADYLVGKNKNKEGGIAYEYLGDYTAAMSAYRSASLWRETLSSASLAQMPKSDLDSLAKELAESLEESKEFQSAATIRLEYLGDIENSARLLCRAYQFSDAIRLVSMRDRSDLLKTVIDPGLIEGFNTTSELLADCKAQIGAQVPRLRELRIKKEQEPLAFFTGDVSAGAEGDVPDDVSLAPTNASTSGGTFMTRYTQRSNGTLNTQTTRKSSKNRRREERKRARGKKGSVYEEEYLVNSLSRLIERINVVNEDVGRLVEGLMRRAMREQARTIQNAMIEMVELCNEVLQEVFEQLKKDMSTEQNAVPENMGLLYGDTGFPQLVESGRERLTAPVVKKFERLLLLT